MAWRARVLSTVASSLHHARATDGMHEMARRGIDVDVVDTLVVARRGCNRNGRSFRRSSKFAIGRTSGETRQAHEERGERSSLVANAARTFELVLYGGDDEVER